MVAFEQLRSALHDVRIAHHISGRIRFKLVGDVAIARPQPHSRVDAVVKRIPGVHRVRANVLARSCTVEYDPGVIPDAAWRDFLCGIPSDAAATLERVLRAAHQEIAHAEL